MGLLTGACVCLPVCLSLSVCLGVCLHHSCCISLARAHTHTHTPSPSPITPLSLISHACAQRIEELIGKKMVLYPTEEDIVLQLSDRVGEAQRIATQVRTPNESCKRLK